MTYAQLLYSRIQEVLFVCGYDWPSVAKFQSPISDQSD